MVFRLKPYCYESCVFGTWNDKYIVNIDKIDIINTIADITPITILATDTTNDINKDQL